MVFEPALSTPDELDAYLDPDNPEYGFATESWTETPLFVAIEGTEPDILSRRLANADAFKQHGSKVVWNRYVILGFYVYDDCNDFDAFWRQFVSKQTICMKMVWFNFMYHVDRTLDIHPKLQTWALEVAHPHLSQLDPSFLRIDTVRTPWSKLLSNALRMDNEEQVDRPWTLVNTPKSSGKSYRAPSPISLPPPVQAHRRQSFSTSSALGGLTALSSLRNATSKPRSSPKVSSTSATANHQSTAKQTTSFSPAIPPLSSDGPTHARRQQAVPLPTNDVEMSDTKMPAVTAPLAKASTHDGTHRLTFRWKPKDYQTLASNPIEWLNSIFDIMNILFTDRDGEFYRWESEDLSHHRTISQLTPADLRDFISPRITSMDSLSTFVFGIRFRFKPNTHISWRNRPQMKTALRDHHLGLTISNSSCSSGRLVVAGYILFKAPNTTHRARYLQSIRNHLPDNTPFFDLLLYRRTPTDDANHHLAVQCGENHVHTLTSALSAYLTGKGTAFFLPRLAFAKLTQTQIQKYFDMHKTYIRSLRPIQLSPAIFNLDAPQEEQAPNGTIIQRTTREWATSLKLADGSLARCDVTNGSPDRQTYLLVPSHNVAEVKLLLRDYRFSLNILDQRETRFRDSLPGLPDEILIDLTTQDNLDFLEQMSSEDIWQKAPAAIRKPAASKPNKSAPSNHPPQSSHHHAASLDDDDSSTTSQPPSLNLRPSPIDGTPYSGVSASNRNPQSDEHSSSAHSNGSKHSLSSVLVRMDAFYKEFQQFASKSDAQFSTFDSRLTKREASDALILQRMNDHQAESMTAIKSQFEGMMAQVLLSIAPGRTDPSPPSRRSHSTFTSVSTSPQEHATANATSSHGSHPPSSAILSPTGITPFSHPSSSATSGSSESSSHARPPRAKKSRSIHNDMEHLSMDSDSDLSALGDILYTPPVGNTEPPESHPRLQMDATNSPIIISAPQKDAHPDSTVQYSTRDSNGGAIP